jgi:sugar lactone lactonase YvrE
MWLNFLSNRFRLPSLSPAFVAHAIAIFALGSLPLRATEPVYVFSHFAGSTGGGGMADGAGSAARFDNPTGVAVDSAGNVFVADVNNHTIRKATPSGVVTTIAGYPGEAGDDDGQGALARFNHPNGIYLHTDGSLYVATDRGIRRVSPSGRVTTISPYGANALIVDTQDNIYSVQWHSDSIQKTTPDGVITYIGGVAGSADGAADVAQFSSPSGIAIDHSGTIYVADSNNCTIRKITRAGIVSTFAGTAGQSGGTDGKGAAARFTNPSGIVVDSAGNIYVSDGNCTIRKITPDGDVTTFAGSGGSWGSVDGVGGAARFFVPAGLAVDGADNVYIADPRNCVIRKMTPAAAVSTFVGRAPEEGFADGDGAAARFNFPGRVALDTAGNLYVADSLNRIIRKITPAGAVSTLAGAPGQSGSVDGVGAAARFKQPYGIAVTSTGLIYVTDTSDYTVRRITSTGEVTTLAGSSGSPAPYSDGQGAAAHFYAPDGVAVDTTGNVYVADRGHHTIRKITPGGLVTTLAGDSTQPPGTVDGTGAAARFDQPTGIAIDTSGTIYVCELQGSLRKVTSAGVVSTIAPGGGDAIAVDGGGNLFVSGHGIVQRYTAAGESLTVGGWPTAIGYGSADGTGLEARFSLIEGLAVDSGGNLYLGDTLNNAIRKGRPAVAPTLVWPASVPIVYGTALSSAQLCATADVPGSFVYSWPIGAVLAVGSHSITAQFTPTDTTAYVSATVRSSFVVNKATPTISWSPPTSIASGTALSAAQLSATTSVAGSFVYSSSTGTVLSPGTYTLTASFYPTDTANYNGAQAQRTLTVFTVTAPPINWSTPAAITYGATLSAAQLNAAADVPGTFSYTPAAGALLSGGPHTLRVDFVPTDSVQYTATSAQVTLVVDPATPVIAWVQPSAMTYPASLSASQLNATADVPGTMTYAPAAGAALNVGTQQLTVSFTPTNTTNYSNTSVQVSLVVNRATPTLTWAQPGAITYGNPLSATQLNATVTNGVRGTFNYSPASGTVLHAGANQALSLVFYPDDGVNYTSAAASQTIAVNKAQLTMRADDKSKLQGSANPELTVSYAGFVNGETAPVLDSPPTVTTTATTSSATGSYPIVPSGGSAGDYALSYKSGTLSVTTTSVAPTITNVNTATFTVGQAGSFSFTATGTPSPTFSAVGLPAWLKLDANTGRLTGTPATAAGSPLAITISANNGSSVAQAFSVTINQASPVIAWSGPVGGSIGYGTVLGNAQLNAVANVPGTFSYTPASGAVLPVGSNQTLSVTFTPTDSAGYSAVTKTLPISVNKAPLIVVADNKAKIEGAANPAFTVSYTGFVNGETLSAIDVQPTASTGATTGSPVGSYPILLSGGSATNYTLMLQSGTLTVSRLSIAPAITSAASTSFTAGQAASFPVTATGTPAPTFSAAGLPSWAKFNSVTGLLAGTADGSSLSYALTFTASNGTAPDAKQNFTLTVAAGSGAPSFTLQPVGQSAVSGGSASFTVSASGMPAPALQWQVSSDGGANWSSVANDGLYHGATTETLSMTGVTSAVKDYRYRCVATNNIGSVNSADATLTLASASSLAGTYFGTFPNNHGRWALKVYWDNTAVYIGYLIPRKSAIIVHLTIDANGAFTATGTETVPLAVAGRVSSLSTGGLGRRHADTTASSFTLTGQITAGAVSGQLTGIGETFSGASDSAAGLAASGYYNAEALNTASGATFAIVAASGQAVIVTVTSANVDGTTGIVNSNGQLAATTDGGAHLLLTINASGQSIAATLTTGATAPISFAGLMDTVQTTKRLVNIASRAYGSTGNNVTIGGFVISGNASKRVLVRAVGPSLTSQGIGAAEVLLDPMIEVHDAIHGNVIIASNDNWGDASNAAEITSTAVTIGASALLASDTKSAAALLPLPPGVYSFVIKGKNDTSGVVLLEVFDADSASPSSTFANIATRAYCRTGNYVTIGGFVISGNAPKHVLLRAVGPTLATQGIGVTEVLQDPMIEVHDAIHGNAVIAINDNWGDNANAGAITTTGARIGATPFAATDTTSSALLVTLQPGVYSFVASGKAGASGIVLVEVYDAD